MQLIFQYPKKLESLEIMLATKAYENIWQSDCLKIVERFSHYTGLQFQQDKIEVRIHNGQSMSGKESTPMRLNLQNETVIKKRNALVHELAHRLLFGNGLYAPDDTNPTDNDEIRVLLFQGDVLSDIYGQEDYAYWSNTDPGERSEDHLNDLRYVLSLSKNQRINILQSVIATQLKA